MIRGLIVLIGLVMFAWLLSSSAWVAVESIESEGTAVGSASVQSLNVETPFRVAM